MPNKQSTIAVFLTLLFFLFQGNIKASTEFYSPIDTTFVNLSVCESACPLPEPLECLSGTYQQVLVGTDGCDSLIIIDLNVIQTEYRFVEICEGDCIEIPELDSMFCPNFGGTYTFELNDCPEALVYDVFFDNLQGTEIFVATCQPGKCFIIAPLSEMICPTMDTTLQIPFGLCGAFNTVHIEVNESSPIDSFIFNSCPDECIIWDGGSFCNDFSSLTTLVNPFTGCDSLIYFR